MKASRMSEDTLKEREGSLVITKNIQEDCDCGDTVDSHGEVERLQANQRNVYLMFLLLLIVTNITTGLITGLIVVERNRAIAEEEGLFMNTHRAGNMGMRIMNGTVREYKLTSEIASINEGVCWATIEGLICRNATGSFIVAPNNVTQNDGLIIRNWEKSHGRRLHNNEVENQIDYTPDAVPGDWVYIQREYNGFTTHNAKCYGGYLCRNGDDFTVGFWWNYYGLSNSGLAFSETTGLINFDLDSNVADTGPYIMTTRQPYRRIGPLVYVYYDFEITMCGTLSNPAQAEKQYCTRSGNCPEGGVLSQWACFYPRSRSNRNWIYWTAYGNTGVG